MAYARAWFDHDRYALTFGGGAIDNPGRYLVLVPPINGATAFSGAAPFYTANPGDPFTALRVVDLAARLERGRPIPLAAVVDRLNATHLDWLFEADD